MMAIVQLTMLLALTAWAWGQEKTKEMEWSQSLEAAKKEAQVNVYVGDWAAVLSEGGFQKNYPNIKVVGVDLGPTQAAQRILSERRAGKYLVDVVFAGSAQMIDLYRARALNPIRPVLVFPDVLDESKWWQGRHWYVDPERQYMFRFGYVPNYGSVYYNTTLVNPKEFSSLWDFLHPTWKGKIVALDPEAGGASNAPMRLFYHHPELGSKFIKKLFAEMEVSFFRDRRQGPDWLAVGKFALCFFCDTTEATRARRQGLPVDKFGPMKEGGMVTSRHGILGLVDRGPHPNAAKVFINWLLSREGQISLQKTVAKSGRNPPDSLRIDMSKDEVLPEDRRIEGVNYLELDVPGRMEAGPILKVFREAIAERGRR